MTGGGGASWAGVPAAGASSACAIMPPTGVSWMRSRSPSPASECSLGSRVFTTSRVRGRVASSTISTSTAAISPAVGSRLRIEAAGVEFGSSMTRSPSVSRKLVQTSGRSAVSSTDSLPRPETSSIDWISAGILT